MCPFIASDITLDMECEGTIKLGRGECNNIIHDIQMSRNERNKLMASLCMTYSGGMPC